MQGAWIGAASVLLAAFALPAQTPAPSNAESTTVVTTALRPTRESVRRQLDQIRLELEGRRLPVTGDIVWGSRTVAKNRASVNTLPP